MNPNVPDELISRVKKNGKTGKFIALGLGLFLFGMSIYAFHLTIKVNRLSLRKLKDEGYK